MPSITEVVMLLAQFFAAGVAVSIVGQMARGKS